MPVRQQWIENGLLFSDNGYEGGVTGMTIGPPNVTANSVTTAPDYEMLNVHVQHLRDGDGKERR